MPGFLLFKVWKDLKKSNAFYSLYIPNQSIYTCSASGGVLYSRVCELTPVDFFYQLFKNRYI